MKKYLNVSAAVLLAVFFAFAVCDDGNESNDSGSDSPSAIPVTGVRLDKTTITVNAAFTEQLTVIFEPENATNKNVNWSTSNPGIATVSSGLVTGVSEGTAQITVTTEDGDYDAVCTVTVVTRLGNQLKLTAGEHAGDSYTFGRSVAIDGDNAVVGAPYEDTDGNNSGAAYIFHRTGPNTWVEVTRITSDDLEEEDQFGYSVAISGNFVIVGAPNKDTDIVDNCGAAYVFHLNNNLWTQESKLMDEKPAGNDNLGCSVGLSGNYAIVGAQHEDGSGTDRGAAFVFRRYLTPIIKVYTWGHRLKLTATNTADNDYFGCAVALSGNYAIVGAYGRDEVSTNTGAAYIFHRTDTDAWDEGTKLTAGIDADTNDYLGCAVSISGDYAIAGAYPKNGSGVFRGAAYIFNRTDINLWGNRTKIVASDSSNNDIFGYSVSISGDYAVIGACGKDGAGDNSGGAYIFHRLSYNNWQEEYILTASDEEGGDRFGSSAAISGDYVIIGAENEDDSGWSNSGAAYIFR